MRVPCLLAALLLSLAWCRGAEPAPPQVVPRPRVAVFLADGFPSADAAPPSPAILAEALKGVTSAIAATPAELSQRLNDGADVLLLPYGSAFPLDAWDAIRSHLERGGGLVILGGAPFHQPVHWQAPPSGGSGRSAGTWLPGFRQPTFARELLIGPAEEVSASGLGNPAPARGSGWTLPLPKPGRTFALTVRFAKVKDHPGEDGSAGPREAVLRPLVHLADAEGLPRACPLLEIDRIRGAGAGGRWVLATSDAVLGADVIRACLARALEGASLFTVRPVHACVEAGEPLRFRLSLLQPGRPSGPRIQVATRLLDEAGVLVQDVLAARLAGPGDVQLGEVSYVARDLAPGFYRLEASIPGTPWRDETGVWVRDKRLLAEGPSLRAGRDSLSLDGRTFPVIGTTYMASDVHRKFLFEPEPLRWERDFALMRRQGVNLVRTGLWTAWDRLMLDPGAADEGALRALDAYVHTAARHRIQVCFTFFAFLPPAFGGENPYLDPQSLEGQRTLLTLIARRYADCPWIHWDLINEPSYAPPDALWTNRPMGDRFERRAWQEWVTAQYGADATVLRDLWRDGSRDVLGLPRPEELNHTAFKEGRRPRKVLDFRRFTQEVFTRWAASMGQVLASLGGRMVTVGQDEAGTGTSPSHGFMGPVLGYTAMHTWWLNDDLLWDGLAAKIPERPMLVQETGMMRLEDLDGMPWRDPEASARLLERKFALAFAARGAGVVQWAWDINPYQPAENEAVIGFVRPDGTAKPELRVLRTFSDFFAQAGPRLGDYEPDPVVVVYPHTRVFAGRPGGAEATKRVVRTLAERFGLAPTLLSDQTLTPERLKQARLILVPVPEMLGEAACQALGAASRAGALVLVTGAVTGDVHGRIPESLRALGIADPGRPLAAREPTPWGGWVTFEGNWGEKLRRSLVPVLDQAGRIWHEPLPLEYAQEADAYSRLLDAALKAAGVAPAGSGGPALSRVLDSDQASLVVCVNESPLDVHRKVTACGHRFDIPVAAGRSRLLLVERGTGRILAETPGEPVKVR